MQEKKEDTHKKWYHEGLKFQCTACGKCCSNHGEYSYVYVTEKDFLAIADYLGITTTTFYDEYCVLEDGLTHLKMSGPDCPLLKDNKCSVYPVRPHQCRTWPFWPVNLEEETWEKEVKPFCPGTGKGNLYSPEEIDRIAESCDDEYQEMMNEMDENGVNMGIDQMNTETESKINGPGRKY